MNAPPKLSARTAEAFELFVSKVRERLAAGEQEYGDQSFDRADSALQGEIDQELFDVVGWAFIRWESMRRSAYHRALDELRQHTGEASRGVTLDELRRDVLLTLDDDEDDETREIHLPPDVEPPPPSYLTDLDRLLSRTALALVVALALVGLCAWYWRLTR